MRPTLLSLALWLAACDEEQTGPSADLVDEVGQLRLLIAQDAAQGPLREVERAMSQRRPVLAAQLLRTGGIPAARRQVERVEEARFHEPSVMAARGRALAAYRERVSALERYQHVLERGGTDDIALAESLQAQSAAERALLGVLSELDVLVPLPEPDRLPQDPHATPPNP